MNLQIDLLGGDAELFAQVDASLKDLEVCGIVFTHSSIVIIIAIFFIFVIVIIISSTSSPSLSASS